MNYILEIKAFQDEVQLKQLSTGQIALWYALMYINNKCNWIEWFTVANRMLESNSGLSRQGILVARNALKQYGYIDFKSNGTKATAYKLNSISKFVQSNIQSSVQDTLPISKFVQVPVQDTIQDNIQVPVQDTIQSSSTLNKQNETKQNETNLKERVESAGKGRQAPLFPLDSFEYKASEYLRDQVLSMIPNARVPQSTEELQKWAVHIERMKRLDKLSEEEIRSLIRFATTDPFWQTNILSTKKLREKKDSLYAQMKSTLQKKKQVQNQNGIDFTSMPKGAKGVYDWMMMENFESDLE